MGKKCNNKWYYILPQKSRGFKLNCILSNVFYTYCPSGYMYKNKKGLAYSITQCRLYKCYITYLLNNNGRLIMLHPLTGVQVGYASIT
jgi:hypothetical protein